MKAGAVRALVADLGGGVGLCERILDDFETDLDGRIRALHRDTGSACTESGLADPKLMMTVDAFGADRLRGTITALGAADADADARAAALRAFEDVAQQTLLALRLELAGLRR